ncbi:MAG TPA: hypothetical protein VFZ69_02870 [Longimicrobiales bacterium]
MLPVDDQRYVRRLHSAMQGDTSAFAELCAELTDALERAVRHHLAEDRQEVTDTRVQDIVERVRALAVTEMAEKPSDWSTYGWLSWLALREMTNGSVVLNGSSRNDRAVDIREDNAGTRNPR